MWYNDQRQSFLSIMENKAISFMRLAKKTAMTSEERFPMGAVLVKSGRVLGRGKNNYNKTNRLVKEFFRYSTLHAEVSCLSEISIQNIKGSIIYVYRVRRDGSPGLAKPCINCQKLLIKLGVKKVVYSTYGKDFGVWRP